MFGAPTEPFARPQRKVCNLEYPFSRYCQPSAEKNSTVAHYCTVQESLFILDDFYTDFLPVIKRLCYIENWVLVL
jgi:hypothetical protein